MYIVYTNYQLFYPVKLYNTYIQRSNYTEIPVSTNAENRGERNVAQSIITHH